MGLKKGIPEVCYHLGPDVRMYRAADGGPTRFPVTGLKNHTTHLHSPPKAGNMILPAESNVEMAVMFLLDISTSVLSYMAQPHLLEFRLDGKKREYTPDIEVIAPLCFAEQLLDGVPFATAALRMPKRRAVKDELVRIVIECKKDRSKEPKDYKDKIAGAAKIYERFGYFYFVLEDEIDLNPIDCSHIPSILLDKSIKVENGALKDALGHLDSMNGVTTYAAMMEALGGGPRGREITNYLHIIGLIWADYSNNPLMREDKTIVARPPLLGEKRRALAAALAG
ncbi:hypothetical protein HFO61_03930 [Rhizobium leguminosarum]|uniref:hypothetical protein n=1 Tax=Rhizobium leguminosarum TaxID=384 RepID=UPI001C97A29E|nr:hypothetical protein [Rhizobium leguminosarum]MBY5545997.1 hypothetical protein [Rhizobium leguminosarum]